MFCNACDTLGVPRPVSIQNDFNYNNRVFEGDVAEACHHFGVVGMPYGALAGGALTGKLHKAKYAGDRPLAETRHKKTPDFQPRYCSPVGMDACGAYVALAEKWGLTPCEMALCWSRDRGRAAASSGKRVPHSTRVRRWCFFGARRGEAPALDARRGGPLGTTPWSSPAPPRSSSA